MITNINKFRNSINEKMNYTDVNIRNIKQGDTILFNGEPKTVTGKDIKYNTFMGISIFGDNYHGGNKLVTKITYVLDEDVSQNIDWEQLENTVKSFIVPQCEGNSEYEIYQNTFDKMKEEILKLYSNINEAVKVESYLLLKGDDLVKGFNDKESAMKALADCPKAVRPSQVHSIWKLVKEQKKDY